MKIAVGMSGGVDSSVTAHLLKKQGHDVFGIIMKINALFGDDAIADAKKVADQIGIPLYAVDLTEEYNTYVLDYLRREYHSGRTPNPCVVCNREVKFGLFLDKAFKSGHEFDKFATGHYAVIEESVQQGRLALRKGSHAEKDQAYFLSLLRQDQLARILFPLGEMDKSQVREIAREAGLSVAEKGESQDLCMGNYKDFLGEKQIPGNIVDPSGKVLGRHTGIGNYTIGQRRGLGIAAGEPIYVVGLNPEKNEVVAGTNDDLKADSMRVSGVNWVAIAEPELPFAVEAKIRYRDSGKPAIIEKKLGDGEFLVRFSEARRAVTPGQLGVFYVGNQVAGAGFIEGVQ